MNNLNRNKSPFSEIKTVLVYSNKTLGTNNSINVTKLLFCQQQKKMKEQRVALRVANKLLYFFSATFMIILQFSVILMNL